MFWGGGGDRINFGVMLHPQHFYNKSYVKKTVIGG